MARGSWRQNGGSSYETTITLDGRVVGLVSPHGLRGRPELPSTGRTNSTGLPGSGRKRTGSGSFFRGSSVVADLPGSAVARTYPHRAQAELRFADLPPNASTPGAPNWQLRVPVFSLKCQADGDFSGGKEHNFQTKSNFLTLTADAAFQLDFFGKLRRATEASRAELLATEDARQTVLLTLVSDVASDYFALLQLDLQLQITRDTVKTQQDSVKLNNLRVEHGVATKLDVLQAQQVLDTANAQIPDLERQIAQEENAISILLGNYPQAVPRGQPLVEQLLPPEVPPGLPSTLLSSAGPTFARPSKTWSPPTLKSESPKPSSFRKSLSPVPAAAPSDAAAPSPA